MELNDYSVFSKTTKNCCYKTSAFEPPVLSDTDQLVFLGDYSDSTWKLSEDYTTVIKKTPEEIQPVEPVTSEEDWWKLYRDKRNTILTQTDWIVTKYTEQNQPIPQEWINYRQALRDITSQSLPNIVWPTKPTTS
jgi:hypothetical protein